MRLLVVASVLPFMGCVAASKLGVSSTSSTSSGSGGESVSVTIPNVFKMKREQAIAELRRAGIQGNISEDSGLCGSVVEHQVIELGEVCYQHPPAGRTQGSRLVVSITVQTEDPRRGNIGTHNEWRLMPEVVGMTVDQARAEMRKAGFERDERVSVVDADEGGCRPRLVCRQYPDPLDRIGLNDGKILYVGPDPTPRHTPEPTTEVARTEPTRASAEASVTAAKPEPKPEPMPESFFTVPSTSSPPPPPPPRPTGGAKKWGGNGAPAFRDEANVPQGPGGPMNRGKGEPCTDKIDHCMRPGVWFAVSGVMAGRQFRATPAFELDSQWWTWYGRPADYQFLFKTKVVEKPSEVVVGQTIVWLVQEDPRRRWVENDFDTLTTSRWTSGVVESVDDSSFKVKGWSGPIAFDTARVIVETKQAH